MSLKSALADELDALILIAQERGLSLDHIFDELKAARERTMLARLAAILAGEAE
jgi:hypothetical protein